MEYWKESLSSAAEECGVVMTAEQLNFMAEAMQGSYEYYGLYSGQEVIPDPSESQAKRELEELKRKIQQKTEWVVNSTEPCTRCSTVGTVQDRWGRDSDCPNCNGKGRVHPGL